MVREWPGDITIVNSRPRNPKCQGLVEQGNHMVNKMLGARFHEHDGKECPEWSEWLPLIYRELPCHPIYVSKFAIDI